MKNLILGMIAVSLVLLVSSASAYVSCEPDSQVNDTITGNLTTVAGACTNHDSGCLTGWECKDGVAVKADYYPPELKANPESASASGYHPVDGKYCYANPNTKPDCGGKATVSDIVISPTIAENPTDLSQTESPQESPKRSSFMSWLRGLFGLD